MNLPCTTCPDDFRLLAQRLPCCAESFRVFVGLNSQAVAIRLTGKAGRTVTQNVTTSPQGWATVAVPDNFLSPFHPWPYEVVVFRNGEPVKYVDSKGTYWQLRFQVSDCQSSAEPVDFHAGALICAN